MGGNIVCIAAVLLGVDAGWRPHPDGGIEYLIQIEPHLIDSLKSGATIASDVDSKLKDVRAYRITVGTEKLPRVLPPTPFPAPKRPKGDENHAGAAPRRLPQLVPRAEPDLRPPAEPRTLPPLSGSQPIGKQPVVLAKAVEVLPGKPPKANAEAEPQQPSETEAPATGDPSTQPQRSKPWLLTLFGLFASLGGNVYLVWVAAGFRTRYYAVVRESGSPDGSP